MRLTATKPTATLAYYLIKQDALNRKIQRNKFLKFLPTLRAEVQENDKHIVAVRLVISTKRNGK